MFKRIINLFSTSAVKLKLIQTSLQHVPTYGWTTQSIHIACSTLNLSPAAHKIVTPFQLISYQMKKWNQQSLRIIDDTNFNGNKLFNGKIKFAIKIRLEKQIPVLNTWADAMKIGAMPENIVNTKNLLWEYSTEVFDRCKNQTSQNIMKKMLFNSAYVSTQLFMLTDKSQNYHQTWKFLQNRIDNLQSTDNVLQNIGSTVTTAGNGLLSILNLFNSNSRSHENK